MAHSIQYTKIMNSQRWHNLQSEILRAKPYCERCEAKGWRIPSKVVHHIKPIKKEPKKRNLVFQIRLCNNKIFELWQNN